MGTLVAMRYPTNLALGLADHTYVKCANDGKAWSCWGGKTGGKVLVTGSGSTSRADAIAGHDEKAGIRCYLINGVCHQSANRILSVANATVQGARGYWISHFRFDTYGRKTGKWPFHNCVAPFNQYPSVSGDLPECIAGVPSHAAQDAASANDGDQAYLAQVKQLYAQRASSLDDAITISGAALVEFMVTLFKLRLEFSGVPLDDNLRRRIVDIRVSVERRQIELEESVGQQKLPMSRFPEESDRLTLDAQKELAGALDADRYMALFHLKPGDWIKLADPDIAQQVYGSSGTGR